MTRLLALVAPIALLAFSGTAAAALPNFQNNRITPKAIGGVKLGMTFRQAKAAWGSGGYDYSMDTPCSKSAGEYSRWECTWRKSLRTKAWVGFSARRADTIGIAGRRRSRPGRLRTSQGWGLGTKGSTLFMKGCQSSPGGGQGGPVPGVGAVYTCNGIRFYVSSSTGRTVAVAVG